jgi:hypothetical protein
MDSQFEPCKGECGKSRGRRVNFHSGLRLRADDLDGARGIADHGLGHASEQQPVESPSAVRSKHDEGRMPFGRAIQNRLAGIPVANIGTCVKSCRLETFDSSSHEIGGLMAD